MRRRTGLLYGLVVGLLLGIGAGGTPAHAIAHGTTAKQGEYPFAVKLTMLGIPADGGTRDSSCSGGLIAARWVLTAGHCFRDINGKHVARLVARTNTATVGRADLTDTGSGGQEAKVIAVKQNPLADVALAQLDRPITGIAPMRLSRKAPAVGQTLRLTGFGLLNGKDTKTSDKLQTGLFTIRTVNKYDMGVIGKSPKRDTSACEHDSGGPYFVPDRTSAVVYGVVSHGPDCPHTGPDRSSRIDTVDAWILGIIGRDGPLPAPKPTTPRTTAPTKRALPPAPPAAKTASKLPYAMGAGGLAVVVLIVLLAGRGRGKRERFRHRRPG